LWVGSRKAFPRIQLSTTDAKAPAPGSEHRVAEIQVEGDDDQVVREAVLGYVRVLSLGETSRMRPDGPMAAPIEKHGDRLDHVLIGEEPEPRS
jgi:hypothetical protein